MLLALPSVVESRSRNCTEMVVIGLVVVSSQFLVTSVEVSVEVVYSWSKS